MAETFRKLQSSHLGTFFVPTVSFGKIPGGAQYSKPFGRKKRNNS